MFCKIVVIATAAAMLASPATAQEEAPQVNPSVTSKFKMSLGGFVKLDYVYNSVNLGPASGIGLVATLQPNGIPKSGSVAASQDQSIFSARQSRLWFKTEGPPLLGGKTAALIETDFFGSGGSNEGATMRMRLAYGTLDLENTQFLFGQSWDLFAPAAASTVDFGHGQTAGNPTTPRLAQLRVTQKVRMGEQNTLKLVAALQNPIQNTNTANGTVGETWGAKPNIAGQAMLVSKALGVAPGVWGLQMNALTVGIFGLYGNEEIKGNSATVDSLGYGLYAFVPILPSKDGKSRTMTASFEGQAYRAENMSFNYATVSPLIGPTGNKTGAKGYGLFGQLIFYPAQNLGFATGYGMRGAEEYGSYTKSGIKDFQKSNSQIFANVSYDLNTAVRVATEYQHVSTRYGNVAAGTSDSGKANVFRYSMIIFF